MVVPILQAVVVVAPAQLGIVMVHQVVVVEAQVVPAVAVVLV
jgi:hypothetical protein